MPKNKHRISNEFKKGFESLYYAKVRCPVCKEKMYATALTCPNCKTDLKAPPYNKITNWQNTAMKVVLLFSFLFSIGICISGIPVAIGTLAGVAWYGGGYVVVQKIQSFKNYHHK